MIYSTTFSLLLNESLLAKSAISDELRTLKQAGFDDVYPGKFYSSFFHLSIGLERLMKLVYVTEYMLCNGMKPPNNDILKKKFSHNLKDQYQTIKSIGGKYNLADGSFFGEDDYIHEMIIHHLHEFASSARYYNLDTLTNSKKNDENPLSGWYQIICETYLKEISESRRAKISATTYQRLDKEFINGSKGFYTGQIDFDGHPLTIADVEFRRIYTELTLPHTAWYCLEIIQSILKVLDKIQRKLQEKAPSTKERVMNIPYFNEIFTTFIFLHRSDALKRKTFD